MESRRILWIKLVLLRAGKSVGTEVGALTLLVKAPFGLASGPGLVFFRGLRLKLVVIIIILSVLMEILVRKSSLSGALVEKVTWSHV